MKELLQAFGFFSEMRKQMRFGEFSRMAMRLRRFEIAGDFAECEWFMRPADPWDTHLPPRLQEEHLTHQALQDALKTRELIFRAFPQVNRAMLRMYRSDAPELELMMVGEVERSTSKLREVASLVMRARLHGFRFSLRSGALERLTPFESNP
jgi:hypothetical protein